MAYLDSARWEWGRLGPFCKSRPQFFNAYKVSSDSSCPKVRSVCAGGERLELDLIRVGK